MATEDSSARPYGYVYLVTNSVNGKVYVGQTANSIEIRWAQHCRDARRSERYALHAAIRKYGVQAFEIIQIAQAESPSDLDQKESAFVAKHRANERGFGYNIRSGGNSGGRLSPETREKLRLINLGKPAHNKGKPMPEYQRVATIERLKAKPPCLGRTVSEETRAKIRAANRLHKGRKASEETREKMRESHLKRFVGLSPEDRRKIQGHNKGVPRSAEICKKIGDVHRGKVISSAQREHLRAINLGKKLSPETRQKIGQALKGKPTHEWSEESRKRASESARNRRHLATKQEAGREQ